MTRVFKTTPWTLRQPVFDYPSSKEAARELGLVDADPEAVFDKYPRLVQRVTGAPVALVSFVEETNDRHYFKAQIGLDGHWAESRHVPLSHSFCQYVKRDDAMLVIENAPEDERVCHSLAIPELGVRAYLGMPIHDPNWEALGALSAIDTRPRAWSADEIAAMRDLAACVTDQIQLRAALHYR